MFIKKKNLKYLMTKNVDKQKWRGGEGHENPI